MLTWKLFKDEPFISFMNDSNSQRIELISFKVHHVYLYEIVAWTNSSKVKIIEENKFFFSLLTIKVSDDFVSFSFLFSEFSFS